MGIAPLSSHRSVHNSAAYAEPDNLRTPTAVIDTSAQRAESAI